jgi:hypothetical protein
MYTPGWVCKDVDECTDGAFPHNCDVLEAGTADDANCTNT